MKISLGTTSELKIRAVKCAFAKFEIDEELFPVEVVSGVSKQPFGFQEIITGSRNRASSALMEMDADLSIGIENGIVEIEGNFYDLAGICIIEKNKSESLNFSAGMPVPEWAIAEIKANDSELGLITQRLSHGADKDPMNYFSNGKIKREEVLSQAIILALAQIFNKNNYSK